MKYSFESYVRYSEIGEDRNLTLNSVINYFQDCSTFHSEHTGVGIDYLQEKNRVWVLSSWQIVVDRYPKLCEKIKITTWPYAFKRFLGSRNFTMEDESGATVAYANSLWTYLDLETGMPANVSEQQIEAYTLEEKYPMEYAPRKIKMPVDTAEYESFPVRPHHLDTNHHVNNCQYIQMAMDYLPVDFKIRQMRAEYKQQARLHDTICPEKSVDGDKIVIKLNDTEAEPYAVVEFVR